MTANEKIKLQRLIEAVAHGIGDRAGNNQNDQALIEDWSERFGSRIGHGFDELIEEISERIGYDV